MAHLYGVFIFQDHITTMLEPCLAKLYFQTSWSTKIFNTESKWSMAHLYGVSIFLDHVRTILGPYLAQLYFQIS